jgi:hypothetical protein
MFDNMVRTIAASRALLGRSRGHIQVAVTLSAVNGAGGFYSRSDDRISIWDQEMLGARGVFVAAHEYGHAVHEKALNGNKGGNCPSPHYFDQQYNATCAYSEGFANYHSAATRGAAAANTTRIETPIAFTNGMLSEQAVAAFLYDITDPKNEPHDSTAYPGSYVANLIRTCEIIFGGVAIWNRTDALDGIIYCMEQTVVPSHEDNFFRIRSSDPWAQREVATEPGGATQTANVRRIWLRNLYNR